MDEIIRCYNCGKIIDNDKTREHIPARTLFEGYDEKLHFVSKEETLVDELEELGRDYPNLRERINKIIETLEVSKDEINEIMDEEQEALDNMPENLQDSERAELSQNAIDLLDSSINNLEEVISNLEEATE